MSGSLKARFAYRGYHYTAQSNRSSVRPLDNDNDGLLDEDSGEDLDGDGALRQMRRFVGAGKGNAIKDPKDPKGRAWQVWTDLAHKDGVVLADGAPADSAGKAQWLTRANARMSIG